jgi:hypothetical protein
MWPFQSRARKEQIAAARSAYSEFARAAATSDPQQTRALAATLEQHQGLAVLSEKERRERSSEAFRSYAENVLADDHLTEAEEGAFREVAAALGIGQNDLATTFGDLLNRLVIARVNDGRLGVIDEPHLIAKKGEVVHLETPASLMKQVAQREWRGGTSGVSFHIAKGVTYRTGAIRGRSVVAGTELQVADSGVLSVTSQRIAYLGNKTIEMTYAKLMSLDVFSDGVRVHVSNRQNAPLFRVDHGIGEVIAATVNAAMQRLD